MEPLKKREIRPCPHMANWVSAMSDGSLKGMMLWYTRLHVRDCLHCREAHDAMQDLETQLGSLNTNVSPEAPATLTPERKQALNSAMDELDREAR